MPGGAKPGPDGAPGRIGAVNPLVGPVRRHIWTPGSGSRAKSSATRCPPLAIRRQHEHLCARAVRCQRAAMEYRMGILDDLSARRSCSA
jgi:hypothetical protein